ncbi:carboxymethylenebutenolidase [Paraburkholderia silvatlantica]|uniref:Carboxymethylenebutenolidase n=1 Tax=Paraburkholderia silvatlantica TaxID=321895 RepID=A0A2V4U4U8_9BURK|nr:dienelactone hydrolase family protein [Paraburkholderia silvatlantica]PYE25482.1 carboxymethylenebutenolidase [Paraburkholderia silvatlantica]
MSEKSWIEITNDDGKVFSGYLSLSHSGKGPGLVLVQEIWGVNEHIRALADMYALAGFTVLAPDVFWRNGPRTDLMYGESDTKTAREKMSALDNAQAARDVAQAAEFLRQRSDTGGKVAILGFCLGGQLAYRAAPIAKADALVAFYGGGIDKHLDVANYVTMPALFHFAEDDAHIPATSVDAIRQAVAANPRARVQTYAAVGHGFCCWGRPMYDQRNAAIAHGRTLDFLGSHL